MSADARTIGWLSRALTHEMSAVQQYLAQSVLARLWGDYELSMHLRREAVEEMQHAERLMERLIVLGITPSAGSLPPARLGRTAEDMLVADRKLEVDAVRLYEDALAHANRMRDGDSAILLESILGEELAHVREIDAMKSRQVQHG